MASCIIQLPMGIKQSDGVWTKEVELDEMTGEEEDILSDVNKLPGGQGVMAKSASQKITEILSRCTKRLGTDSRPVGKDRINLPGYFEPHWTNAFTNDRGVALIRLRQVSLGDTFVFSNTCPHCGTDIKRIVVDLSTLEIKSIELEELKRTNGIVKTRLASGKEVTWKALSAADESKLEDIHNTRKGDFLTALLQLRIVAINGVKPTYEDIRKMPVKDRNLLRSKFDSMEGGIDTELVIECDKPSCGKTFKTNLNPGDRSFFFPLDTQ